MARSVRTRVLVAVGLSAALAARALPVPHAAAQEPASAPSGARSAPSTPVVNPSRFAVRLSDARGVSYAAEVAPGLWRGSQPDAEGIAWLKKRGIKTVVNLRRFHRDTERELVQQAGLHYEYLPMSASEPPSRAQVQRFLRLVSDAALRPIYVHCAQGVDRTGTMLAVYRMEVEGWSSQEAFAEMESFGAHAIWRDLRHFVRHYRARESFAR